MVPCRFPFRPPSRSCPPRICRTRACALVLCGSGVFLCGSAVIGLRHSRRLSGPGNGRRLKVGCRLRSGWGRSRRRRRALCRWFCRVLLSMIRRCHRRLRRSGVCEPDRASVNAFQPVGLIHRACRDHRSASEADGDRGECRSDAGEEGRIAESHRVSSGFREANAMCLCVFRRRPVQACRGTWMMNSDDDGPMKASSHRTSTFLNCQGSLSSMSSGNRPGRSVSGVQSV